MSIAIKELFTDLKKEDVLADILELADTAGLPITAWQAGEVMWAFFSIVAEKLTNIWNLWILPPLKAPFLDYSTGDWLTLIALRLYGVQRDQPGFARGPYVLTNTSNTPYTVNVGDLLVRSVDTNKTYRNSTGGFLPGYPGVGAYPTLEIEVVASEAGTASSASAGEVTTIVTSYPGVQGTNPSTLVGVDVETDASLVARCRSSMGPLSPMGPKLAYDFVAKNTLRVDGSRIEVNRTRIPTPPGDGTMELVVASPSGEVSAPDVALIQFQVEKLVEPICTTATVRSADPLVVAFTATVFVRQSANISDADLTDAIEQKLVPFFASSPIAGFRKSDGQVQGKLYIDTLKSVISSAQEGVYEVDIVNLEGDNGAPVLPDVLGDLPVDDYEVPTLGIYSTVITQVAI